MIVSSGEPNHTSHSNSTTWELYGNADIRKNRRHEMLCARLTAQLHDMVDQIYPHCLYKRLGLDKHRELCKLVVHMYYLMVCQYTKLVEDAGVAH